MKSNHRQCEMCKEWFDEDDLDFMNLDNESWLVCKGCEEQIKEDCYD